MTMMELQTKIPVEPSALRLTHNRRVMLVGSCFTESVGERLVDSGFDVMLNPFGILYNPLSMAECLRRCLACEEVTERELVCHNGLYHSWLHHGSFSHADMRQCLDGCNARLREAHAFLRGGCTLMLTFGSAYAYYRVAAPEAGPVVNCHKVPASSFRKQLLTVDEVVEAYSSLIPSECDVVVTVSPIRHWADTPHGNQLGKATLLLATERILSLLRDRGTQTSYFPSYEIVMDELRDYRFYDVDMLHPSPLAVDIIWERLVDTYMDAATRQRAKKYRQLHKMESHRPLFPDSEAYRQHLVRIEELRQELASSASAEAQSSPLSESERKN